MENLQFFCLIFTAGRCAGLFVCSLPWLAKISYSVFSNFCCHFYVFIVRCHLCSNRPNISQNGVRTLRHRHPDHPDHHDHPASFGDILLIVAVEISHQHTCWFVTVIGQHTYGMTASPHTPILVAISVAVFQDIRVVSPAT